MADKVIFVPSAFRHGYTQDDIVDDETIKIFHAMSLRPKVADQMNGQE